LPLSFSFDRGSRYGPIPTSVAASTDLTVSSINSSRPVAFADRVTRVMRVPLKSSVTGYPTRLPNQE